MKQGEKKKIGRPERPKTYAEYLRKAGYTEERIKVIRSSTYSHPPSLANKTLQHES